MPSSGNHNSNSGSPWTTLLSFLTTVPGIITAIATLIGAIGGILLTMHQIGWINAEEIAHTSGIISESTTPEPSPAPPTSAPEPSPAPPTSAPEPSPAPQTPAPEPSPAASLTADVLFKDDFSDTSSGWPQLTRGGKAVGYTNGGYRMYVPPSTSSSSDANWHAAYSTLGPTSVRDVTTEVDVARIGNTPSTASAWGVTCRYIDNKNFYTMGIRSDGSYYISVMKLGSLSRLALGDPSSAVRADTSTNHIRADCKGSTLTLYVNNQKLLEANDTSFDSGHVGLFENNNAAAGPATEVLFDNFVVRKL